MDRHHRRRALIETFEQRILYSADPLPSGELVSALVGLEHTDGGTADGGGVELVFVDTRSPDLQLLLDDLEAQRQAGRDLEVILIEQDEDGIAKVSEALAGHHDVAAVHLVGHGSEGLIELGASRLNMDVLLQRASEIAGWGDALVDSGDLLLYGCDVAAGTDGEALVTTLSQLTGADVAASIDTTGSALLGGDWDLERQTGSVEARPFASASLQAEWGGVLGVVAQSTETLVNQNTSGSQGNHWSGKTVGMDSSGNYVVVWMDGSGADGSGQGIYARRYDVNGTALGNAFRVNSYTFDNQRNPQVAMAANGSFVVVWESMGQDGSNYGIYAQRYNASGVVQGSEFRVNTLTIDDQREPAVAMDANGNFVITYQAWASGNNSWGVVATRYNASGVVQGAEFIVNTTLDFDQQEPSVAMDSAGNFVITWQSYGQEGASDGIYAQRYNASGVALGGEFHVNTTTTDNQNLPTVAMDSSGNFVITWESYAQDGSLQGIYGQRYNSSGVAQGGEFRLNTTTANAQQNPVVTMTGGGSFAVTWQSTAQDGSLEGVYMRLYDASGNPVIGETRVNTTTTGDQHSPSIVSNQNGRMVIAWQGNGSGDGDGVFMQRYTYGFPPVLTMSTGSATYVENAAPLSDAGATVTDPNTTVFNGGQLIVQLTSNGTASDELGIRNDGVGAGQIGVSGANVTYGGVVIGTFSGVFGNGSTPLTVTLNGNASVAATQALVRAVTYRDTSDAPSTLTRTLSLTLSDGTGWTSNPATISLAVVAQNDAPVHSVPGAQSTPISTSLIFSSANGNPLVVSDADSGGGNLQVSLTITNGSLSLSRITGLSFTSGDGSSDTAMTFSGNLANINAALEGLVYTPTTGYNGAASLGITTSDLGNTGSGGALTDSDSITIQVGAVRFQQDVAGYTGTVDTYVSDGATGTSFGNATTVIVDDGSPVIQGLLRFDSMFGSGAGQIPFGATINSASLSFYVTNRDAADTVSLYTMLGSWSEASTWSSLGSGVQMNGTEAASSPLTTFSAGVSGWNTINGLASSVQVWADNGSNQGWLLASANPGADNWTFASSEYATVSLRPYLVISYTAPIAPTITSNGGGTTASVNTAENATAVTTVTATDADSTAAELSYSIVGGADAGKFSINAATGALRFITAPNYELPTDTGSNNVYDVTVQVSDGFLSDTQAIAVAVTPVNDNTPVISSNGGGATAAISLAENTLPVTTVTASDADLPTSTLTYTIIGGADSARFSLNSSTGQLSFLAAPNYEVPSDAGANNVYDVTVQVSDGTYTDTQAIAVTITAVNDNTPAITSNGGGAAASVGIVEHTTAVTTVTATDADLPAQTLTYSIAGGNDAGQFTVDSGTGVLSFITAPNFESPVDFDANNIYDVIVQVSDGTLASTQAIAVTVSNINEAPILNATPAVALAPIAEDAGAPAGAVGTLVSALVDIAGGGGWDNFSDPDLGASTGLAVIGADATSGTWYYTINGGSSWSTLGTPTTASARLLAADTQTRVYFAPASNFNGSLANALTFRAWDRTSGSNGGLADTSTNGGASAFSTATDTAALSVTAVNDEQSIVSNTGATFAEGSLGNIITSTMLRTTDVDNSAAQLIYTLGTAPGVGTLYRSGVALGAGGSFTQADVDSNLLTYTHGGGENTADSFSFTVDDGAGSTSSASFAITITGVNDNAPVINSNGGGGSASISMPENNTAVTTVTATDGDIPTTTLSYSIAGGTDAAHFSINPTTGVLQFVSTADFETPLDVNGDNVYHINVQVSDGSLTDTQTLIVTINDVVNELVVTTAADLTDGDTSSITALLANMGGDGKISLREAILAANNSAGADTITFAIGSGPQVIHLNSVLPAITSVIHIEGTSQTGYAGTPLVMLDGAAAGATATGLEFSPGSSGSSVRGLAIGNFSLYGIHVNQVSAVTIAGNYLGTDLSGALAAPNGVGLFISESGNNIVGGTSAADRNIISGNTGGGVVVSGATATNNVIQGNYIGLDRTGTADLGNGGDGVSVQASASNNLIGGTTPAERNVISGNTGSGVRIYSTYTDFNTVSGNYIGTNAAGTANIGNAGQGVELDGVSGNIIGSLTSGGGNLISGNAGDGVLVENGGDGNLIFGNTIVANGEEGIQVWGGAINTVIGHSTPAARNIISGNAMQGIGIYGITSGTVVRGNWIGVAADGVTAQGNGKQGIHVSQASSVMIGGSNPGEGNIIANAGALHPGISLSDGANGVVIIGNSIYGSSSLGIDLDGDWVTANDPGDADVGSNNLQNTPELLSALLTGSDIALSGTLNSLANTRFRIEFFANPGPHASGYGEGRSYIGFVDVLTDASGNASFGPSYAGALPAGSQYWISSTATRLDGSSNFVETSEFSASIPTNPPVITSDGGGSTAAVSVAEGTTEVTTVIAVDPDGAAQTITYSIVGGADAGRFTINASSGLLEFSASPDFEAPADANGDNLYEVIVRASDGLGGTDSQAISVSVTNVNDEPGFSFISGNVDYAENAGAIIVAPTATVTDPDSANFDGGRLVVYFSSGGQAEDRIALRNEGIGAGQIGVSGGAVTFGGVLIGSWSGGQNGTTPFVVTFNASATPAAVQSMARNITYQNVSDAPSAAARSMVAYVEDGDGSSSPITGGTVTPIPVNDAPVITSNSGGATGSQGLEENATFVTTVTVSDPDGPAAVFSIAGGNDGGKFTIDGSTGVLSFVSAPDFEAPTDLDGNNVYEVIVQVSDGSGGVDTQALSVSVSPANDNAPQITSNGGGATAAISLAENTAIVTTVTATDADQPTQTLSYAIVGGADGALFSIDGASGVLSFLAPPDFETPADADSDNTYAVTVQVADGAGLTSTQGISVSITAANDNAPEISSDGGGAAASISVEENTTAVTTVTATDVDQPVQTLTYSISGGADAARFQIDGTTGMLSFLTAPDFEVPTDAGGDNVYDVIVQAADGQGGTDTQAIAVTVTSSNDNPPIITSGGTASVAENSTAVMTVTATDADQPAQTLTYSISGGADAARFQINADSGVLSFLAAPDFEAPTDAGGNNVYDVIVQVSDGQGSTDTQAIAVTVTSANDSAPVITSPGNASVAENTTAVMTVTATDSDQPAQTLTYSIVGGADAAHFQIDANTGVLSFLAAPDFESPTDAGGNNVYDLIVQVSDGQGSTDTQAIAVTVTSTNDSAPVITSPGNASLAENTTAVMTVTATDADQPAQTLTYSIVGGADAAHFQIDANTGVLSFLTAPDFEAPTDAGGDNVYDVIVQVSDGQGSTDTQAIAVTVTSANDSAPVITSPGNASVAENTTAVMSITATDADQPAQTLTYSIVGGADAAHFQIDANTGVLSFLAAPDFEAPTDAGGNNVYDVIVQVADGQGSTDTQAIAVTVTSTNDSAPVITSPGNASLAENTTAVMTVTATDADQPAQTLTYSIVGGADAAHFQIDANTGVLSFLAAPDFEAPTDAGGNNVYDVIVQVSDGQGSTDTQAIAVTVTSANDSAPVITSGNTASVAENTTAVMTVTATDADQPAQTLTYSISGGADAARFQIDANTGVLSFLAAPDFEAPTDAGGNNVYDVIVQVADGQGSTDTQAIAVTVTSANDSAPVITSGNTASVAENTTAVMTVTATDADQPAQTLTYSISGGADAARFQIDGTTGALSFLTAPDFEAPTDAGGDNVYDVIVKVSDGQGSTDTQAIAVTVTSANDSAPVITSPGNASVAENTTAVMSITATDADQPAQTLTYSISGGADAAHFQIDGTTGMLSFLAAPDFEAPTDAGGNNVYDVIVQVSDGQGSTDTQAIAVTVTSANDSAPVITSPGTASVAENTTAVMTVTATDSDQPAQTLAYSIVGGADAAHFQIDANTGVLSFLAAPDFEAPTDAGGDNVYDLIVQVSDGQGSTDTQAIAVTVTSTNDSAPVITSPGTASVAENTTAVMTVAATDADQPAQTLTYSIVGGADAAHFQIDANTGVLSFLAAPNFEAPTDAGVDNVYDVIVQVSDGQGSTDTQAIAVTVISANDSAPVITSGNTASVAENTTAVMTVTATDADQPAQTLTYSISGGADAARFQIDANTGVLSFLTAPDFEAPTDAGGDNVYDVIVQVSDGQGSTDTQAIAVTVYSANDSPPLITSGDNASVAENTTAVMTVTATDADQPAQALTYSIVGGADAARFAIDGTSGLLRFIAQPDFERPADAGTNNIYNVIVQVSDGTLATVQSLTINVTALNEAPQGSNGSILLDEDSSHVFSTGDFGFSDPGDNNIHQLAAVQIISLPSRGVLSLNGRAVIDGEWITATDIATGQLRYTPPADASGQALASLSFRVQDNGGTANGGVDTEAGAHALTLNVSPLSDTPIGVEDAYTLDEDSTLQRGNGGVLANDTDPDGTRLSAELVDGPAHGQLELAADGSFRYTPKPDWNGTDSFSYRPSNGQETGEVVQVRLTVTPVNDAPSLVKATFQVSSGGAVTLGGDALMATDVDSAQSDLHYSVVRVENGHFELRSAPGQVVSGFSQADLLAGSVVFRHEAFAERPVLVLRVSDGQTDGNELTASVGFTPAGGPGTGDLTANEPPPSPVLNPRPPPATPVTTPPRPASQGPTTSPLSLAETPGGEGNGAQQHNGPGDSAGPSRRYPVASLVRFTQAQITLTLGASPDGALMEFMLSGQDPASGSTSTGSRIDVDRTKQAPLSEPYADVQLALRAVELSGIVLSVGAVWWATRAGGLVASLLMVAPAWRTFDPLPVLGPEDENERDWGRQMDEEMTRDEIGVADLFDQEREGQA